jgi:hypothetical protein
MPPASGEAVRLSIRFASVCTAAWFSGKMTAPGLVAAEKSGEGIRISDKLQI